MTATQLELNLVSACHRHPDHHFIGFCPSCLCDRLSSLDPSSSSATTVTASSSSNNPNLRRSKSLSLPRAALAAPSLVPQRKSVDDRGRDTLRALFRLDDATALTNHDPSFAEEARPIKEYIDLDARVPPKKPPFKEIAGSFWLAASAFSRKLQQWKKKKQRRTKKDNFGTRKAISLPENLSRSKSRRAALETQSKVAVHASHLRSCDIGPRFSLDARRMSTDDPRYSLDKPRASWDGYIINTGRSAVPHLPPTTLPLAEDYPLQAVQRKDGLMPVEDCAVPPGGTVQTRDYYLNFSQSKRRSFDRSSSTRRSLAAAEQCEPKNASNARVSPALGNEFFNHLDEFEREFRKSNSSSWRDECSERFAPACEAPPSKKEPPQSKMTKRTNKRWSILGFLHRRGSSREIEPRGVENSLSGFKTEQKREISYGSAFRADSSVSSGRHSFSSNVGYSSVSRNSMDLNGHARRREDFALDRIRGMKYSPCNVDNGLLRFYLTPVHSRRCGSSSARGRHWRSHSLTKSMPQFY